MGYLLVIVLFRDMHGVIFVHLWIYTPNIVCNINVHIIVRSLLGSETVIFRRLFYCINIKFIYYVIFYLNDWL